MLRSEKPSRDRADRVRDDGYARCLRLFQYVGDHTRDLFDRVLRPANRRTQVLRSRLHLGITLGTAVSRKVKAPDGEPCLIERVGPRATIKLPKYRQRGRERKPMNIQDWAIRISGFLFPNHQVWLPRDAICARRARQSRHAFLRIRQGNGSYKQEKSHGQSALCHSHYLPPSPCALERAFVRPAAVAPRAMLFDAGHESMPDTRRCRCRTLRRSPKRSRVICNLRCINYRGGCGRRPQEMQMAKIANSNIINTIAIGALAVCAIGSAIAVSSSAPPQRRPIRIAAFGTLTGPVRSFGINSRATLKTAAERIDAAGGVKLKDGSIGFFDFSYADDHCKPDEAIDIVQRAAASEAILGIGPSCSSVAEP